MKFNKTIIITDPCYISKDEDWGNDFDYSTMTINNPNITNYIWDSTIFGDGKWRVYGNINNEGTYTYRKLLDTVVSIDKEETRENVIGDGLGTFTADSGCFGVFYLDEVLKYNPELLKKLPGSCYTIVKNFNGCASVYVNENQFHIIGVGNIYFYTI